MSSKNACKLHCKLKWSGFRQRLINWDHICMPLYWACSRLLPVRNDWIRTGGGLELGNVGRQMILEYQERQIRTWAETKHYNKPIAETRYQAGEYSYLTKTGEENRVFILWLVIRWLAAAATADWQQDQVQVKHGSGGTAQTRHTHTHTNRDNHKKRSRKK